MKRKIQKKMRLQDRLTAQGFTRAKSESTIFESKHINQSVEEEQEEKGLQA
jgi:hypothetical protein